MTFQQNWDICCSLSMMPMTLDSAFEQECLSNMTKVSGWTGNHNYWTGGTQQACRNSWGWCGNAAGPRGITDDVKWEVGQPDNLGGRQDCVHLKNVKGSGLLLTDRNCTDRYILACKVIRIFKKKIRLHQEYVCVFSGKSRSKAGAQGS